MSRRKIVAIATFIFVGLFMFTFAGTGDGLTGIDDTLAEYLVSFRDYDNTLLEEVTVTEGEDASYTGEEPTREADLFCTYEFTGWNESLINIQDETDLIAVYECTAVEYDVTFLDYDNDFLAEVTVEAGETAVYPNAVPTRQNFVFVGWSAGLGNVLADFTVTAVYAEDLNNNGTPDEDELVTITFDANTNGILSFNEVTGLLPGVDVYPLSPTVTPNNGFLFDDWNVVYNAGTIIPLENAELNFIAEYNVINMPTLEVTTPLSVEVGTDFDLHSGVTFTVDPNADQIQLTDILVTGTVNTNKLGTYELTYTLTDSFGNTVTKNRTVKVLEDINQEEDAIMRITATLNPNVFNQGEVVNNATYTVRAELNNGQVIDNLDPSLYTTEAINTEILADANGLKPDSVSKSSTVTLTGTNITAEAAYSVIRTSEDKELVSLEATLSDNLIYQNNELTGLTVYEVSKDGSKVVTTNYSTNFNSVTLGENKELIITSTIDNTITTTLSYSVYNYTLTINNKVLDNDLSEVIALPGSNVEFTITFATQTYAASKIPTYTIMVGDAFNGESTFEWTPTAINDTKVFERTVKNNVAAGNIATTKVMLNNVEVASVITKIEEVINVTANEVKPMEVVLLLDVSASMWKNNLFGTNCTYGEYIGCSEDEIIQLRESAEKFVRELHASNTNNSEIYLTISTFGNMKLGLLDARTNSKGYDEVNYSGLLNDSTIDSIINTIRNLDGLLGEDKDSKNHGAKTNLFGGLKNAALNQFSDSVDTEKILVVFGDGDYDKSTDSAASEANAIISGLSNKGVTTYAVGLGLDNGGINTYNSILTNGGKLLTTNSADEITKHFNSILAEIIKKRELTTDGGYTTDDFLVSDTQKVIISYVDANGNTITEEITNFEPNLNLHNLTIVNNKFVWDISKLINCEDFDLTIITK